MRPFPEISGSSPSSTPHGISRTFGLGLVMASLLGVTGCKEETPRLFNEDGVWQMLEFDIGGGLKDVDEDFRKQAMLLKFRSDIGVVQSAFCAEDERQTAADSTCRIAVDLTAWHCHCYAYAFEDELMAWREFEAGEPRPSVSLEGSGDTDEDNGEDGESANGTWIIDVQERATTRDTFLFSPLPEGLFGSDGEMSRFTFQRKAGSLFNQVLDEEAQSDDDPNATRPVCEPCADGF